MLDTAKQIDGAPKIVPWVPLASENADTMNELNYFCTNVPNGSNCSELSDATNQSMVDHVTNLMASEYPDQRYFYNDKPLILEAANDDLYPRSITDLVRPELEQEWTCATNLGLEKRHG